MKIYIGEVFGKKNGKFQFLTDLDARTLNALKNKAIKLAKKHTFGEYDKIEIRSIESQEWHFKSGYKKICYALKK